MRDSIFFKFQGSDKIMDEAFSMVREIVPRYGGADLRTARSQAESEEIWRGRKVSFFHLLIGINHKRLHPTLVRWHTGQSWR